MRTVLAIPVLRDGQHPATVALLKMQLVSKAPRRLLCPRMPTRLVLAAIADDQQEASDLLPDHLAKRDERPMA